MLEQLRVQLVLAVFSLAFITWVIARLSLPRPLDCLDVLQFDNYPHGPPSSPDVLLELPVLNPVANSRDRILNFFWDVEEFNRIKNYQYLCYELTVLDRLNEMTTLAAQGSPDLTALAPLYSCCMSLAIICSTR